MRKSLMLVIMALSLSAIATAAELPDFESIDIDNNGQITQEEAEILLTIELDFEFVFERVDTNKDGVIDREEYNHADQTTVSARSTRVFDAVLYTYWNCPAPIVRRRLAAADSTPSSFANEPEHA